MSLLGLFLFVLALVLPITCLLHFSDISNLSLTLTSIIATLAFTAGPVFLLLCLRFFTLMMPKIPNGRFQFPQDRGSIIWAITSWPVTTYLRLFQSLFFTNEILRYLVLKSLSADVAFSSWITGKTQIIDPSKIHIGKHAFIAEHTILATSFQPRRNLVFIGEIWIGNESMIGAYSKIFPGVRIGKNVSIEHSVEIYQDCIVGDNTKIGPSTIILSKSKIGANVRIGRNCFIPYGKVIPEGARIPDFSKLN